jgi:hypothetical protein
MRPTQPILLRLDHIAVLADNKAIADRDDVNAVKHWLFAILCGISDHGLERKMIAAAMERLQLKADVRDLCQLGGKFFGDRSAATIDVSLSMQMIKRIVGVQRHDGVNVMRIPRVRIAAGDLLII